MKRLVLTEPYKAVIEEVEKPSPGPGQILLKIAYAGICGSDLHASIEKHPFMEFPSTPGHEFSGWVEEIGPDVDGFSEGDRVTCEPNLVCGKCYCCKIGRYNICENLKVMGCQSDGAMADYFLVPAEKTIKLPDTLGMKEATLIEPVAVGTHAVHKAGDLFGKNIVIIGAGMIGLGVLAAAKKAGAERIIVIDLSESRLQLAKEAGADYILKPESGIIQKVTEIAGFEGIDVVFECVGVEATLRTAMDIVYKGGRIIVMGVYENEATINAAILQDRELELHGSLMYTMRDVKEAMSLLSGKKIPAEKLFGKVFSLDECHEAFDHARNNKEEIKTLFCVNEE